MKVKVIRMNETELPKYETIGSAGMDVRANIKEPITLAPGAIKLIPIGLKVEIPLGYELQVRPRSGLALKHGLGMANSIGTIDSDYRAEIGVILINLSNEEYRLEPNERVAQIVFNKFEQAEFEVVEELDTTERTGGFGSTGK